MAKLKFGRHTQSIKDNKQNKKRQLRNKTIKTRVKTSIKKIEKAINKGKIEDAKKLFIEATSELDKAANKKIIHKNKAARKKSTITKKLNNLLSRGSQTSA